MIMSNEINNYITELETIYDGEPWYGKPLMAVLKDADAKAVFKKQNNTGHSAYEVLHHVLAWRELLVKRLNGDTQSNIKTDSETDWSSLPAKQSANEWNALVRKIQQNQKELINGLSKWKDDALDKNFAGSAYPLRTFLHGQIQHDIYHIGQIALALKNA
jgi:uncharacterized damage-inducible protein DinB